MYDTNIRHVGTMCIEKSVMQINWNLKLLVMNREDAREDILTRMPLNEWKVFLFMWQSGILLFTVNVWGRCYTLSARCGITTETARKIYLGMIFEIDFQETCSCLTFLLHFFDQIRAFEIKCSTKASVAVWEMRLCIRTERDSKFSHLTFNLTHTSVSQNSP